MESKFYLENDVHVLINGQYVHFGVRCQDENGEYVYLTNKEIDELNKEFRIVERGWRHAASIVLFSINGNAISQKIPKKYIDQLEYMGYNIDKLEYVLLEDGDN